MHRKFWGVLLLSLSVCTAFASGIGAVRQQAENSMLVTGTIDVGPDGSVSGHAVDQSAKLPPEVLDLLDKTIPDWKFEPVVVEGHATKARGKMSLRVVASTLDARHYSIEIRSASFGQDTSSASVRMDQMQPPGYPNVAARSGVSGTVYLVLRIGRDGHVQEAVAEQVNLEVVATEKAMALWRDVLAHSSLVAAKQWTFIPPTTGSSTSKESWSISVPVQYQLRGDGRTKPRYGKWEAYIPGPRQVAPWLDHDHELATSADAFVPGTISQIGNGLRLLTP